MVKAGIGNLHGKIIKKYLHGMYIWNYLFILPGIILLFLFSYVPMYGILIAFKNYIIHKGIFESPWNNFGNFIFIQDPFFWFTVKNTLLLTVIRLIVTFPAPIVLALMVNEVRNNRVKNFIQSATYLPHFISWVVIAYIFYSMTALDTGIINNLLQILGFDQIHFMGEPMLFRPVIILAVLWSSVGWSTIIYLAALSGVNPELHESAHMDGAGRLARIWYINIPGIMPTISILLILSMPSLLSAGYESILPFVNAANMDVSSVLDVYVVRLGLSQAQFGKATAIGLVVSIISLLIVLGSNYAAKKFNQSTLL